jgi:hypothetical protein
MCQICREETKQLNAQIYFRHGKEGKRVWDVFDWKAIALVIGGIYFTVWAILIGIVAIIQAIKKC